MPIKNQKLKKIRKKGNLFKMNGISKINVLEQLILAQFEIEDYFGGLHVSSIT